MLHDGDCIYAVGDIHGEARLLELMLRAIRADCTARSASGVTLVLLGDLIDRGPDGAALIRAVSRIKSERLVILKGNHEAALVDAYKGDKETLAGWLTFGAEPTLTGFGLSAQEIHEPPGDVVAAMRKYVEPSLIAWIDQLPTSWTCGDYFFAHAGVLPGVKLGDQRDEDLLWIRNRFLASRRYHGKVIVHGHTVERGVPALGGNRIGLDTGAHEHGVLTALGLQREQQWLLQVSDTDAGRSNQAARLDLITGLIRDLIDSGPPSAAPSLGATLISTSPQIPLIAVAGRRLIRKRAGEAKATVGAGFAAIVATVGAIAYFSVQRPMPAAKAVSETAIASPTSVTSSAPSTGERSVRSIARNAVSSRFLSQMKGMPHSASVRSRSREMLHFDRVADRRNVASTTVTTEAPRLTGAALEKALVEDREITRRRNLEELSRLSPRPTQ